MHDLRPNNRLKGARPAGFRDATRAAAFLTTLIVAASPLYALALDREGAIDAAKRQTKAKCGAGAPCTFSAKMENNKWFVRVDFTRTSPQDKASPKPGGHAIFIFDQTGKMVGRMEGE